MLPLSSSDCFGLALTGSSRSTSTARGAKAQAGFHPGPQGTGPPRTHGQRRLSHGGAPFTITTASLVSPGVMHTAGEVPTTCAHTAPWKAVQRLRVDMVAAAGSAAGSWQGRRARQRAFPVYPVSSASSRSAASLGVSPAGAPASAAALRGGRCPTHRALGPRKTLQPLRTRPRTADQYTRSGTRPCR
jgi:hypothetical protein